MYSLLKPILFLLPPETAHTLVCFLLKTVFRLPGIKFLTGRAYRVKKDRLKRKLFGIEFPNPVGLAAGFDKDARYFNQLAGLGFGFIEIGTVTPLAQTGNPKPRLFRLTEDEALINRMGFNNRGVKYAAQQLAKRKEKIIIGGNIGKNKLTPNDQAIGDYEKCFRELFTWVDYFVVNVSSPNTPGLRELQEKEPLKKILMKLNQVRAELNANNGDAKPILLKIAPDLSNEQLDDIVEIVTETKIAGVVATNTTLSKVKLKSPDSKESGGLSGKPLRARSTEVIRYLHKKSGGSFPIIGAGGIHSPEDAIEKIEAGASLVQIYTGFIYEGPSLVKKILNKL